MSVAARSLGFVMFGGAFCGLMLSSSIQSNLWLLNLTSGQIFDVWAASSRCVADGDFVVSELQMALEHFLL